MQQTPDNITTHSRVVNPKIPANGKKFSFQGGSVVAILTQEKKPRNYKSQNHMYLEFRLGCCLREYFIALGIVSEASVVVCSVLVEICF